MYSSRKIWRPIFGKKQINIGKLYSLKNEEFLNSTIFCDLKSLTKDEYENVNTVNVYFDPMKIQFIEDNFEGSDLEMVNFVFRHLIAIYFS